MGYPQLITTPAPDFDLESLPSDGTLTTKMEKFALAWARTGNKAAAYRTAYNVAKGTPPQTIYNYASLLSRQPAIAKRYREFMQEAAAGTVADIREALTWQLDIAMANPNDLAYVAARSCRYCHGIENKYQWVDADEFVNACVKAFDNKEATPTDEGGYGYSRANDPALECPHCLGEGIREVVIRDTTKLEGKALKLFKGIDYKNGEYVVMMHDQQKAWEMVCRMLGGFNDKLDVRALLGVANNKAERLPEGPLSEQEAARGYLALIG